MRYILPAYPSILLCVASSFVHAPPKSTLLPYTTLFRSYSVAQEDEQGGVYAYKLNQDTHSLEQTDSQLEAGAPPCYVEVAGNTLTTANYHKGSVGLFSVKDSGEISPGSFAEHDGKGPHERQEKSHLHFAGFSPCEQYIFACDLGGDDVITYQVTAK